MSPPAPSWRLGAWFGPVTPAPVTLGGLVMGVGAELVVVIGGSPVPLAPVDLGPVSPDNLILYASSRSCILMDVDLVAVASLVAVSVAVIVVTCKIGPDVSASGKGATGFVVGVDVVAASTRMFLVISQSLHLWTTRPVSLQ